VGVGSTGDGGGRADTAQLMTLGLVTDEGVNRVAIQAKKGMRIAHS
jgi:hypothetical protein